MASSRVQTFGLLPTAPLLVVAATLGHAPRATAASAPPIPAIQQYVEQLPTSGGSVVAGSHGSRKLPPALAHRIDAGAGKDAAALKKVVSQIGYGAPSGKPRVQAATRHVTRPKPHRAATAPVRPTAIPSGGAVSAAAGTLRDSGSHTLVFVVAAVVAATVVGLLVAIRRRRPWRPPTR